MLLYIPFRFLYVPTPNEYPLPDGSDIKSYLVSDTLRLSLRDARTNNSEIRSTALQMMAMGTQNSGTRENSRTQSRTVYAAVLVGPLTLLLTLNSRQMKLSRQREGDKRAEPIFLRIYKWIDRWIMSGTWILPLAIVTYILLMYSYDVHVFDISERQQLYDASWVMTMQQLSDIQPSDSTYHKLDCRQDLTRDNGLHESSMKRKWMRLNHPAVEQSVFYIAPMFLFPILLFFVKRMTALSKYKCGLFADSQLRDP